MFELEIKNNDYVYDEEKIRGYNPVRNKTFENSNIKYTDYPVPVKFWHCKDDPIVAHSVTEGFVNAIRNAGRIAYLRSFETGGHEPQLVGNYISNPVGNTNFRGEVLQIRPAEEETLLWIRRFNKTSIIH